MIELIAVALLFVAFFLCSPLETPTHVLRKVRYRPLFFSLITLVGCLLVAWTLHEPIPHVVDEFSYTLMADTFAHGHVVNPTPPLPEFFDTFHVLMYPVYVSKYFPAQGLFLAFGQKLTGHPAVGIWLGSALACAATYWMLEAWIGATWALFGSFLMIVQYGMFSYWSQSYWGGMVAALGGALTFGAARRLWDGFSWKSSVWLALGIVVLVNSRPLEGILALIPITGVFVVRLWRERLWHRAGFWHGFAIPTCVVLAFGAFLTCSYNRAITGSPWKPPFVLHDAQYQESPQFFFQSMRPKLAYSSPWVQYYYAYETRLYQIARDPQRMGSGIARRLATWWAFFCGVLLTPSLVLPGLLRKGKVRYMQAGLLVGLGLLWMISTPQSFTLLTIFDQLVLAQAVLLWFVFDSFWPRLALVTSVLLILESLSTKLLFPHYSAPAACLILYLQVEGLRRVWQWDPEQDRAARVLSRTERRRLERQTKSGSSWLAPRLRGLVYFLPVVCAVSLILRVAGRINGWKNDPHGPDRQALLMDDWSMHRANLEHWLDQQPGPQLVFVWYSSRHRVIQEWVYNHADLAHSKVIWARSLGAEYNRLLLKQFPDRTVWLVDADRHDPQLIQYSEVDVKAPAPTTPKNAATVEEDQLGW